MAKNELLQGYKDTLSFGLIESLLGRRSRRFFMSAEIPDGVFAYESKHTTHGFLISLAHLL
jgi:hypothetical protein